MICPKCGFEQPDSPECMRCGIIVSRYKGSVLGAVAAPPPAFASAAPTSAAPMAASTIYGGPEPAMAAAGGGTLYDGPLPAEAGGGTMYGGTPYDGQAAAAARPGVKGDFGAGKVLGESFSIYFANFIPFVLLTALVLSPLYLAQVFMPGAEQASPMRIGPALFILVGAFLCPYIATAAITYGVFQQMRNRDASIGDCLGRGLSFLFPILGLAIVQGLRILLGFLLCFIPGILWSLQLAVSIPAAVEERTGISESMQRSTFLTDGFRGEVFGVLFVIGFINIGLQFLLAAVAAKNQALALILTGTANLLYVGLSATATAVMYYRLRSIKESIDVDQIASVFA